ncbi:Phytanoyl-CoA dioxygenase (PhyH) [compost metagenome]
MNSHAFFSAYRQHHCPGNSNRQSDEYFLQTEKVFLNVFQVGLFEIYDFLYNTCRDDEHFRAWLIDLKGMEFYDRAVIQFNEWYQSGKQFANQTFHAVLSPEQLEFWNLNGYLKIEKVIDAERCDAIVQHLTEALQIDLGDPASWYKAHPALQGMMLQLYQGEVFDSLRQDPHVRNIFASLYGHGDILPNCDKVSFNPPVNEYYTFKGSPLHWDIDFSVGPRYYIQGLVYLNDVPANRGPLTLIPGYHHHIENILSQFSDPEAAMHSLREKKQEIPVPGQKGDLIVWLESLPHAASPNHSELPRFVQYLSFSELKA